MSGDHNQCFSESQMTEALKAVGLYCCLYLIRFRVLFYSNVN